MPAATSVAELLLGQARRHEQRPLLIDAHTGQERTYGQVRHNALRWVAGFRARGLSPGQRVAVVLPNSLDFVELYLGAALEGLTICPYNPALLDEALARLVERYGSQLVLAAPHRAATLERLTSLPTLPVGRALELPDPARQEDLRPPDPQATMVLVMTSGTTGGSKACLLPQQNLCWTAEQSRLALGIDQRSRYLTPLPLFHINPQVIGLLTAMAAGGAVATGPRLPAAKLWQAARQCQASGLSTVPAMIHDLLASQEQPPRCLRFVVCSSAPLSADVRQEFERRFGLALVECYGLCEAGCYATYGSRTSPSPAGSVGKARGCEVQIVTQQGRQCAPNKDGQVLVRGPGVFAGYDGDPVASAAALKNGWLHTGDLGHLDQAGQLYIRGRIKEMINRGGEKISPHDVEAVLSRFPGIAEAAVFSVPHERLGEEVAAAVVFEPNVELSDDQLWDICLEQLAEFETPREWCRLDELPRGPTGKVLRRELSQKVGGEKS